MKPSTQTLHSELSTKSKHSHFSQSSEKLNSVTSERWDHKGFEQLELEHQQLSLKTNEDKLESSKHSRVQRERKPDRQLYSARQRNQLRQENERKVTKELASVSENCNNESRLETSLIMAKEILNTCEEDYDGLSISNVSTAISDKCKGTDEDISIKLDQTKEKDELNDSLTSPSTTNSSSEILLELMVGSGNETCSVIIYKDEEELEAMLENVCLNCQFDSCTGLYFKINVLQFIKDSERSNEKWDSYLDKLLELNHKLIMYESGLGEFEECLAPFVNKESQPSFKSLDL